MNRPQYYKRELFAILETPDRYELCERQLSGFLLDYIKKHRIYEADGCSESITLTPKMKQLTGLPYERIILTKNYRKQLDWWQLIRMISQRWKD